jgi:hypothetical protein
MHKENNTRIENIENIKISLSTHLAKLDPTKKIVHGPTRASDNSCRVTNINIYKYKAN